MAYPILLNPARAALTGLLELNPKINAINKNVVHVITTTVIFLLSLISMAVNSIDVVLGFCGCLGSSLTSFIFPGYFYFRVFREDPSKKTQIRLSIVFIVVGFIFLVAGFILQVLDVI